MNSTTIESEALQILTNPRLHPFKKHLRIAKITQRHSEIYEYFKDWTLEEHEIVNYHFFADNFPENNV